MASWFQDAFLWPELLFSGKGRDQLKNDIKYGEGTAAVGNPLHGLTAGFKVHELMSPTVHINDRIQDIKKNGFDADHLKWAIKDQNHNLQDAFKENIPALGAFIGGGAGGAFGGSSGGAAAAGGASGATAPAAGGIGSGALEGVTVVGSSGGGIGGGIGAGLGGASGFMPGSPNAPMEGVTVTAPGGGLGMGSGTEAAMAAAGAGAGSAQSGDSSWWDQIKDQMGQGGMGQQQPQQQQQMPPPQQRRGLGQPSIMDRVKSGLFPVDSRAADAIGPEALAQQRNQAMIRMGLGMMAASNQGAGLGEALFSGLDTAQRSLDGAMQRGYENAREARQEQRQAERDQLADDRYAKEFDYRMAQDEAEAERADRAFERSMKLDERALSWRDQDISREDAQFDRRMRVAEDRRNGGIAQPPSGYRWNAKGDLEPIPGGPADPSNKTGNFQEAERTAAFLGSRLANSLRTLKDIPIADQTPGLMERGAEGMGSELAANFWRNENRQKANAAQRDALDAALTLATGAAYTKEQIDAMRVSYFPQIGDTDAVIQQKNQSFKMLLEAARVKAGRAADQIDEVLGKSVAGATGGWSIEEVQ